MRGKKGRIRALFFLMLADMMLVCGCSVKMQELSDSQEKSPDGLLTVTFLDVGQGNAILAEQEGAYMLIDGGDREYSSYVVSYLQKQGVEKLDYVIASHYDADHLNGVVGALNALECDMVLAPDYVTDSRVYDSFCAVIEEKDIPLVYPAVGDTYSFGEAEFTVVCPDTYEYADDNDNSVGIRLVYGENSFLICGDAGKATEERMVDSGQTLRSDVYLASHHGSAGSSYRFFLEEVQPEAVVISAGFKNSYGHPSGVVLSNIRNLGAALYRTDLQGEIVVTSDGSNLSWNAQPCMDYRSGEEITEGGQTEEGETQQSTENMSEEAVFLLNMSTKKFHRPDCSSVEDMNEENKAAFSGSREELMEAGYSPCGRCNP